MAGTGSVRCLGSCRAGGSQDTIVHVNADVAGGVTYPLPSDATYPQCITAGPVGSIWFTRSSSPSMFSSPSNGSIGYLDQASGATMIWKTGSRSAPQDLIQAPDETMWFSNRGAVPGIGHINAAGVGAITAVGNYEPTSLTWGADGAIWFTDNKNNSIVRVTTDQLQTTNVDLGEGVTMKAPTVPGPPTPPGSPGTPPAPGTKGLPTGAVVKPFGVVKVKKLKLPVSVACPATATSGCIGTLRVTVGKKAVTKTASYRLGSGAKTVVKAKVTAKGKRLLKAGRKIRVTAALTAVGAKKPGTKQTFKVLRK